VTFNSRLDQVEESMNLKIDNLKLSNQENKEVQKAYEAYGASSTICPTIYTLRSLMSKERKDQMIMTENIPDLEKTMTIEIHEA
jgi:hypothetical protein